MPERSAHADALTELVLEIFRVNRLLLDAGDALAAPAGLSSARWQVLGVVEHGPIPVAHVARVMGLTRQSVQQTADDLAADGMLVYAANPQHRRSKLMAITPAGREALDAVQSRHAAWANRVAWAQPMADLRAALRTLHQLRETLEREGEGGAWSGEGTATSDEGRESSAGR